MKSIDSLGKANFRKCIDKSCNYLFSRYNTVFIICILIYILFKTPIESFLDENIVYKAIHFVRTTWYNDFVFLILIVVILVPTFLRKYLPSKGLTCFLCIISLIYLGYRITDSFWEFASFYSVPWAKYFDVLLIITVSQIVLLNLPIKSGKQINNAISFSYDEPVTLNEKDCLGYGHNAKLLSDKILKSHFEKAFTIGINGRWGSGKTSFINLVKQKIRQNNSNVIEIDFNPWNSYTPQAVIQDFFETFQDVIRPYHSSLPRLLSQYSNKLIDLNNNSIFQPLATFLPPNSLKNLFDEINKSLKVIDRKVIVYIDDLDRLDKNEIMEVIRLVRNTANFYNTFFIVAYDRNYVVNALKQNNTYREAVFLEKIFQLEISMPYFDSNILRHQIVGRLKEKFDQDHHERIEKSILGALSDSIPIFNEWIENMRDVTRLVNSLQYHLEDLIEEVDLEDFIKIELLHLKYPSVYELFQRKSSEFIETNKEESSLGQVYQLKNADSNEMQAKSQFQHYLLMHHDELFVSKIEIPKVVNLVQSLFERGNFFGYNDNFSHLSIKHPSMYYRYFTHKLLEGNLSEVEFSKARKENQVVFNGKITEWVTNGKENDLRRRFVIIKDFDNQNDYEKIINGIFYLANLPSKTYNRLIGYDPKDLSEKLNRSLIEKIYNEDVDSFEGFINGIFASASPPFEFEAGLIKYLRKGLIDFVLTTKDLKTISIGYLKRYCERTEKLDSHIWHLYHASKQTEWKSYNENSSRGYEYATSEAKNIVQDFIFTKDVNGFLLAIINQEPFDEELFAVNDFVVDLFGSWEEFKKALDKIEENEYIQEFKKFFLKFESYGFGRYVKFYFRKIPVKEKFEEIK